MSESTNETTMKGTTSPPRVPAPACLNAIHRPAFLLDEDARIRHANNQAHERFIGEWDWSPEDWNGGKYPNWIGPHINQEADELRQAISRLAKHERECVEVTVDYTDQSPGRETVIMRVLDGDEQTWILAKHGEKIATQSDVERFDRAELLNELHETTRSLMDARSVDEVVSTATSIAADYFDFATVGIRLLEDGELVMKIDQKQDDRLKGRGMPPSYKPGEGFVGKAYEEGEAVVIDDLRNASSDLDFDYLPMKSAMLLPLEEHGIIGAASAQKGAFDDLDLELGRQFATDVKLALDRAHRVQELKETTVDRDYLRSILDSIPGIFFTLDWDGRVQSTNQAMRDLLDCDRGELQNTPIGELIELEASDRAPIIDRLNEKGDSFESEASINTENQSKIPVYLSFDVLKSKSGYQHEIICSGFDLTEQKRKTHQLREQRRRLSLALNAANAGVWVWNLQTGEEFWDENTEQLFGLEPGEFGGEYEDFRQFVHPDDRSALDRVSEQAIEETGEFEQEFRVHTADGELRWLLSRGEVFPDQDDKLERMIGVTVDITQRKNIEEDLEKTAREKDALLREIHHRVKNNMQIINSMLSMQARQINDDSLVEELNETKERVRAMAMVHEHLYQSSSLSNVDIESYLETLCRTLIETNGMTEQLSLDLFIEDVDLDLDIDQTIACGLIVNELVMNSLQHGFPGKADQGTIEVQLESTDHGQCRLMVRDDGRGFDRGFEPDGETTMGLRILDSLVDHELGGTTRFSGDEGAAVEIRF